MTPAPAQASALARPVVIDPVARRFLLQPDTRSEMAPARWTVPAVPIRPQESCRRTATRYLRRERRFPALRLGAVIGHLPAGGSRGSAEYIVLAAPAATDWPQDVRALMDPGARWWSTAELRDSGVAVEPETLPLLIDGYWEGWLPDGVVSLE